MIRSKNTLKNACASVFSERSIHATIAYYEFSTREPQCLKGKNGRGFGMTLYLPDREASLIKKEYCRCGPHPLQVISSRARPPLVKGAGCIGPLFPDFRGWPLWFMASIALRGLHKPCTGGCSWHLIAL